MITAQEMGEVAGKLGLGKHIISGRLPHGAKGLTSGLDGEIGWEPPERASVYDNGHRKYLWEFVLPEDKIYFWTGRHKGKSYKINSISESYSTHVLWIEKPIFNPRKGDKYSIFREE